MNYDEACVMFDVKPTKRQKRKWESRCGRAYRLATHFGPIHFQREAFNLMATIKNEMGAKAIVELEAEDEVDHDKIAQIESMVVELEAVPATSSEIRRYLGQ